MAYYRILSLDGGGMLGLITAIILERLEAANPGFMAQFDLFAGTSTGGLLALGFASGKTPSEARQLYEQLGNEVFADSLLDDIHDLGNLIGAEYSNEPLKDVLSGLFGNITLGGLQKRVLISAFDLDNHSQDPHVARSWKAKFFHNFPGEDSDVDQSVVDVAIYTSAAPTYFPIYQGYIDGGVVACNPSICALAQALDPAAGAKKLEQVVLLSMGTGLNPKYLDTTDGDWGLAQWAPHLVSLMLEGSADLANYQCHQLLRERYLRLNPILPYAIEMDQVDQMPKMIEVASQYDLSSAQEWLERYF
jgi:patatin-like phospholipase/acyl hydrolase